MRRTILAVLSLVVFVGLAAPAVMAEDGETEHKFGYKPESFEVKFYIQPRYTYDLTANDPILADTDNWFGVRRARIYLTSKILPNVKGRVQFGTRPTGFKALDAYLDWKFMEVAGKRSVALRVGQFKKPFSYQELIMPSNNLNMVDRTLTNGFLAAGVFASERDQGAMLTMDLWEYDIPSQIYLGVFNGNGPGESIDDNNGKQIVARADLTPFTGLTVGGDLSINRLGSVKDTLGSPGDPYGAHTAVVWGGEAVYNNSGFQFVGEVFGGDNTNGITDFRMEVPTFFAWYAEAIYRMESGFEPGARYESFDNDTSTSDPVSSGSKLQFRDRQSIRGMLGWTFSKNFRWQIEYAYIDLKNPDADDNRVFISQWTVRL